MTRQYLFTFGRQLHPLGAALSEAGTHPLRAALKGEIA
jgi:hypothetical protein